MQTVIKGSDVVSKLLGVLGIRVPSNFQPMGGVVSNRDAVLVRDLSIGGSANRGGTTSISPAFCGFSGTRINFY
jgi:hypothetical protein